MRTTYLAFVQQDFELVNNLHTVFERVEKLIIVQLELVALMCGERCVRGPLCCQDPPGG